MSSRRRLAELTDRWRARREARRPAPDARPLAPVDREALAARSFPYRTVPPGAYVALHGPQMAGYTFDEERCRDAELDAWLLEVGRRLRERR